MKTYTIDAALVDRFEAKLATFSKKFEKYGNGSISYDVSAPYVATVPYTSQKHLVVDITIDASYKISGYEFVASLESTSSDNLIKKVSDDVFVPETYRTRCACDHCKTNRMRKYTVLLKNIDNGDYVQVGKSCVADYLGRDMSDYASYLSIFDSIDDFVENNLTSTRGGNTLVFDFEDIICQTWEYVNRFGYISKAMASENYSMTATSTAVFFAMTGGGFEEKKFEVYDITDDSKSKCSDVIKFIKDLDDSSDYNHNLKTLSDLAYADRRNFGLVVSAVGSYIRATAEKKEREAKIPSEHIGTVGDKIEFKATPVCISSYLGDYGWSYIYKMDVNNNIIVWKTNKALDEVECTIKATIKEHSDFRGQKQTVITRGKVVA
jgi:hypothetical protein